MNESALNKYGISFSKESFGIDVKSTHPYLNLGIFLYLFSKYKPELVEFIDTINLALCNNYNLIKYEDSEWQKELGRDVLIGIINENLTFELLYCSENDSYVSCEENFPLTDIKELFQSLLDFMESN
ncbi:MAG: hypothetical protein CFE23_16560 [Flavobacterium sp. BFFFF1]|uniref:hypothetical protein n=1 Tax=Flavobacterium sp. BFFFF1 TaxID=2015557 RepID=UPI000BCAFECA|nr:hypothetical protein [Flavobacterium sp. BFFFF1]OYU78888.1 MAG: hypothetical protein CFE23_16560 [Flavobacterium sp. BFFFF1]